MNLHIFTIIRLLNNEKSILSLTLIFVFCIVSVAQEESPRQKLLSGKGNIKISELFKETPVLPIDALDKEIYRITFIPTFYKPIRIHVEKHQNEYLLIAKQLSGQGGYDPGKLETEKRRKLKPKEWNHLIDLLSKSDFWKLPYLEKKTDQNGKEEVIICLDGSEWVIEGVKNGQYHAVNRYCPDAKNFEAIGLYLAKISGLRIKKRELY